MGQRLSRDQEKAIAALMTSPNCTEAARKVGVHPNTIRVWLKQPAFLAAYDAAKDELLAKTIGRLQNDVFAANDALLKLLKDKDKSVVLRAVELLHGTAVRATEVQGLTRQVGELLARIAELES